jgi:hypothetical protein
MAGPFVGQVFCQCQGFGWTETYYPNGVAYDDAFLAMENINKARAPLSLVDVKFIGIRVSDMTVRGDALSGGAAYPAGTYTYVGAKTVCPDIGVVVLTTSVTRTRRSARYLRGLPDTILTTAPLGFDYAGADPAWQTAMQAYLAAVQEQSQMVVRHPGPIFETFVIGNVQPEDATIRKAGRPFDLPVGRRVSV